MSSVPAFGGTSSTSVKAVVGLGSFRPPDAETFEDGSRVSEMEVFEDEGLAAGDRVSSRRLLHGK